MMNSSLSLLAQFLWCLRHFRTHTPHCDLQSRPGNLPSSLGLAGLQKEKGISISREKKKLILESVL